MDESMPCDAWDSRCSQLAQQLEAARNHPAIAEYKRMRDALIYIAAHDGVNKPRVEDPSRVARRVLEGLALYECATSPGNDEPAPEPTDTGDVQASSPANPQEKEP